MAQYNDIGLVYIEKGKSDKQVALNGRERKLLSIVNETGKAIELI